MNCLLLVTPLASALFLGGVKSIGFCLAIKTLSLSSTWSRFLYSSAGDPESKLRVPSRSCWYGNSDNTTLLSFLLVLSRSLGLSRRSLRENFSQWTPEKKIGHLQVFPSKHLPPFWHLGRQVAAKQTFLSRMFWFTNNDDPNNSRKNKNSLLPKIVTAKGHPTIFFCKINFRRSKYCLENSKLEKSLKLFHSFMKRYSEFSYDRNLRTIIGDFVFHIFTENTLLT